MLKFICKDDKIIYLNPKQLCEMDILKDLNNFKNLFSIDNLTSKNDNDEYTLLKTIDITYADWFEFISFVKYGVPMYYSLDIFNNPNKKNTFIFNLERLNITCSKFGGVKEFDEFYLEFLEKCKNHKTIYNPQQPIDDYKKLYKWGLGNMSYGHTIKTSHEIYNPDNGWNTGKLFTKKKELFVWFKKEIQNNQ